MENNHSNEQSEIQIQKTLNTTLRIGFIFLLFFMSFLFLKPFIIPIFWGIIIAVATFPIHKKLSKFLKNSEKLSAFILVLIGILIIIIPSLMFTSSTIESIIEIAKNFNQGTISVPAPNKNIAEWPLIGDTIYNTWDLAHQNLSKLITKLGPQLKELAPSIAQTAGGLIGTIVIFIISIIISGALLVNANNASKISKAIFITLAGPEGEEFSNLASSTIRTVVQGVLGTAIIQTLALSLGLFLVDFPGAGIIAVIILIFAIAQLPVMLLALPIIFYVFSYAGTTTAVIFAIWTVIWGISDNIIKPMLMGRGMDIPMIVILLGAIGGMIYAGIIGLFIGAVFLAFSYKVFLAIIRVKKV